MNLSIEKAVSIVGSQSALARAVGVKPQAVNQWLKSKVPAERVLDIEAATNGQVTRHELRPDIYPPNECPDHQTIGSPPEPDQRSHGRRGDDHVRATALEQIKTIVEQVT